MEKLLDIQEVSNILGVTKATIYSWTSQNRIPHVKLSRRLLKFRPDELAQWVAQRAVQSDTGRPSAASLRTARPGMSGSLKDDQIDRIIATTKREFMN